MCKCERIHLFVGHSAWGKKAVVFSPTLFTSPSTVLRTRPHHLYRVNTADDGMSLAPPYCEASSVPVVTHGPSSEDLLLLLAFRTLQSREIRRVLLRHGQNDLALKFHEFELSPKKPTGLFFSTEFFSNWLQYYD